MKTLTMQYAIAVSLYAASSLTSAQDIAPQQAPAEAKKIKDRCQKGTAYAEIQINEQDRGFLTLNDQRIDAEKSRYKRLFHLSGTFKDSQTPHQAFKLYCDDQTVPRAHDLLKKGTQPNTYLYASLNENGDIKYSAKLQNRGKTSMASFYERATKVMKISQETAIPTEAIYNFAQTGIKPEAPESN